MRTPVARGRAILVGLTVAACGGSGGGRGRPDAAITDAAIDAIPHALIAIDVAPADTVLELDLGVTASRPFTATGRYQDGVDEDLTARVAWTIADPTLGAMTGATLEVPAFAERKVATSRITATLDGVAGRAQITVVASRQSGPAPDVVLIAPYQDVDGDDGDVALATALPAMDVLFLTDTTGSMFGAITALQAGLTSAIAPTVRAQIADSQFGVAAFEDFPIVPYGSLRGSDCGRGGVATPDQPFHLFQAITADVAAVQTGTGRLRTATGPIGCGQDWPDSMLDALYQAATGDGLVGPAPTSVPADHTGIGGVRFRAGAVPVIVTLSDSLTHGPGETGSCPNTGDQAAYAGAVAAAARTRAQTKAALGAICARVVGVSPVQPGLAAECSSAADLTDLATATGARVPPGAWGPTRPFGCAAGQCCTGLHEEGEPPDADGLCPLRLRSPTAGSEVATAIASGARLLARNGLLDVGGEVVGVATSVGGAPLPTPHTTADFIRAVTPTSFTAPPADLPMPTFDATHFHRVTPGATLTFTAHAVNDFAPATDDVQLYRATVQTTDGCVALDEHEVLIVVPPAPLDD